MHDKQGSTYIETLFAFSVYIGGVVLMVSLGSSLFSQFSRTNSTYDLLQAQRIDIEKGYVVSDDLIATIEQVLQR